MNSCKKYKELISCLIDGELSVEENAGLMLHVKNCSSCRNELEIITAMFDCPSDHLEDVPEELKENIMEKISDTPAPKKKGKLLKYVLCISASAAVLAVAIFAAAPLMFGAKSEAPAEPADTIAEDAADTEFAISSDSDAGPTTEEDTTGTGNSYNCKVDIDSWFSQQDVLDSMGQLEESQSEVENVPNTLINCTVLRINDDSSLIVLCGIRNEYVNVGATFTCIPSGDITDISVGDSIEFTFTSADTDGEQVVFNECSITVVE